MSALVADTQRAMSARPEISGLSCRNPPVVLGPLVSGVDWRMGLVDWEGEREALREGLREGGIEGGRRERGRKREDMHSTLNRRAHKNSSAYIARRYFCVKWSLSHIL